MHYAWGGYDFIPSWMGISNEGKKPFAEYWMGAHPLADSEIQSDGQSYPLSRLIQDNPAAVIGTATLDRFGELPYLFKVQDVKDMLSIQVHPSKAEAEKGFEAEEAAGIPRNAPHRNYKDRNHKPEVLVALSEFWLLHGFKQPDLLRSTLASAPEFAALIPLFEQEGYKGLYRHVMEMPQQTINTLLLPLVQREIARKEQHLLSRADPGWWVARLFEGTAAVSDIDRGVFSIYFFNIVQVQPGQAVFQGAGIPHAYLEGQTMELMANSDNVLRGGLTPKHVDIPELLKHTTFTGITPDIIRGNQVQPGETIYPCPVPDFGISRISLQPGGTIPGMAHSLEIIVVMDGDLCISNGNRICLQKGEAAAIFSDTRYTISTSRGVLAYKAFVP